MGLRVLYGEVSQELMKRTLELTDPAPHDLEAEIFHHRIQDAGVRPERLRIIGDGGKEYRHVTIWEEDGCLFIQLRQICDGHEME